MNYHFTIEEENLICIYHNADRRRTMVALSEATQHMDGAMQRTAQQTIQKLHNMTDAVFEEARFQITLSDEE